MLVVEEEVEGLLERREVEESTADAVVQEHSLLHPGFRDCTASLAAADLGDSTTCCPSQAGDGTAEGRHVKATGRGYKEHERPWET